MAHHPVGTEGREFAIDSQLLTFECHGNVSERIGKNCQIPVQVGEAGLLQGLFQTIEADAEDGDAHQVLNEGGASRHMATHGQ